MSVSSIVIIVKGKFLFESTLENVVSIGNVRLFAAAATTFQTDTLIQKHQQCNAIAIHSVAFHFQKTSTLFASGAMVAIRLDWKENEFTELSGRFRILNPTASMARW